MLQPFIVGIAFAIHAQWSGETTMDLHGRIEALRARGEPVLVADFRPRPIDPKDNAKADLDAATRALQTPAPAWTELDDRPDLLLLPLSPADQRLLDDAIKQREPAFRHVDQAATKPHADSQISWKSPVLIAAVGSKHNGTRVLSGLVRDRAIHHASHGKWEQALISLRPMSTLAQYAASERMLVGELVQVGVLAMEADAYIHLAQHMPVGGATGATPQTLSAAIGRLLDQSRIRKNMNDAVLGERMALLDAFDLMRRGQFDVGTVKPPALLQSYLAAPVLNLNANAALRYVSAVREHLDAPDWVRYQHDTQAQMDEFEVRRTRPLYFPFAIVAPRYTRFVYANFKLMSWREAGATALAIRWYAADHSNQLPAALEDLVPAYLPRVPRDYLADNKPLSYRAGDRPMLWSVGENGVDDGGREADPETPPAQREDHTDLVWKLQ